MTIAAFLSLAACQAEKAAEPIVIPPGELVQYTNADFLTISKSYYSVEAAKYDAASGNFFAIQDLTPKTDKENEQVVNFLLPKNLNEPGIYLIKVNLPRAGAPLTALVFPGEVARPSIESTLLVDFLTKYTDQNKKGLNLETLDATDIKKIESLIREMVASADARYRLSSRELSISSHLQFLRNYLSYQKPLLDQGIDIGMKYSYQSSGQVQVAPFPFGRPNTQPSLDTGNSTSTGRPVRVRETQEMNVQAFGVDEEGDSILYDWKLGDLATSEKAQLFQWAPGFQDSRPEYYQLTLELTDGGLPRMINWDVEVIDYNRAPELISECSTKTREWETWTCVLKAVDFDGDPISFEIADNGTDARVVVNGQQTDDTTRRIRVDNTSELTISFTPNNNDAGKRAAFLEVTMDDGKMGRSTRILVLSVEDINSPPELIYVNGSPIQPLNPANTVAREWDYCAEEDPDGLGPFRFFIEIRDPDNQASAFPRSQHPDKVSVNYAGTLKDDIRIFDHFGSEPGDNECPASDNIRSVMCFEWKPRNTPRTGTMTITVSDGEHGGIRQYPSPQNPDPITLTSLDRNVRPCLEADAKSSTVSDLTPGFPDEFGGRDEDGTVPHLELVEVAPEVMPLIVDLNFNPLIFRKTFYNDNWIYRSPLGPPSISYSIRARSNRSSGGVRFSRSSPGSVSLNIPANSTLQTLTGSFPRLRYQTLLTVTVNPSDKEVFLPVKVIRQSVPAGKLNRVISSSTIPVTVSNPAELTESGVIRITRSSSGSIEEIAPGLEVGTSELADNIDTVRYQIDDRIVFAVGELSKDAMAKRLEVEVPPGTQLTTTDSWATDANLTSMTKLVDNIRYSLIRETITNPPTSTLGVDRFCWRRRVADGSRIETSSNLTSTNAAFSSFIVTPKSDLFLEGLLVAKRTSSSTAVNIATGSEFRAVDGTTFVSVQPVAMGAGVLEAEIPVRRADRHYNPVKSANADQICMTWSDRNYQPTFTSPPIVKVNEGQIIQGYPIKVTDNSQDPISPLDPLDRHTFTYRLLGTGPEGSHQICRTPTSSTTSIGATCAEACSTTTGMSYGEAATCYLRFAPTINDVSTVFSFSVLANDNGLQNPTGLNEQTQILNVVVVENNDPPVFTDASWNPISNLTRDAALDMGEFIEGSESSYSIYMTDPDKGADLKTVMPPSLVKIHRFLGPSGWENPSLPSGVILERPSASAFNASGWGSKTRAQIRWTPNDLDAKRLAGTQGFVMEVKSCDQGNTDSPQKCASAFYRFWTRNVNNSPYVHPSTPLTSREIEADKYHAWNFSVLDRDYSANNFPDSTFLTRLTPCSAAGTYNCEANRTNPAWPAVLSSYDPNYTAYSTEAATVASCYYGSSLSGYVLPWFTLNPKTTALPPVGAQATVNSTVVRQFNYTFHWCPQRSHIGKHRVYFNITDNGDEDRRGASSRLPALTAQIPVLLNVVAPVFWTQPQKALGGTSIDAINWMKQAYTNTFFNYELALNNSRGNLLTVTMEYPGYITTTVNGVTATSKVGTAVLERYSRASTSSTPTATTTSSFTNFNPLTERLVLKWKPHGATEQTTFVSTPNNDLTWPQFRFLVKDQVRTAETDRVQFRVQVKDPLNPSNIAPTLSSSFPTATAVSMNEEQEIEFSAVFDDGNKDYVHYRWYLDELLVKDGGATVTSPQTASYRYKPGMEDAFLPLATPGIHTLRLEATDGGKNATPIVWTINVRNTHPLPTLMTYGTSTTQWTMAQAVKERFGSSNVVISSLKWGPSLAVNGNPNNLLFAGTYVRDGVVRNFLWRLAFKAGLLDDTNSGTGTQGTDLINWPTGRKAEQISYTLTTGSALSAIQVGSQSMPSQSFASSTDALNLSPSLGSISSSPGSANSCTGSCVSKFFRDVVAPGSTMPLSGAQNSAGRVASDSLTISGNTAYFYAADDGSTLAWGRLSTPPNILSTMTGNDKIGDIAVNPNLNRVYVSIRDVAMKRNFIAIYNASGFNSGVVSLISVINVDAGTGDSDHRILDLAVDPNKNRLYALLPGTGGVAVLDDSSSLTPSSSDLRYVGIPEISSSGTDVPGEGQKLVFNPTSQLLYGISKDNGEIFIIDTKNDAFNVRVFRSATSLDEILTFPSDGLTLAINKSLGWIYLVR